MAVVRATAYRKLIEVIDAGGSLEAPTELQGIRLGPVALLGAPFEIFQAIKNEVAAAATHPIPLIMGLTNSNHGYAVDNTTAAKGGYAADQSR